MFMHTLIAIVATVFLAAGAGLASAAEPRAEPKDQKSEKSVGNSSEQEAEYLATVKKCEGMQAKEKQSCIESAKERFGEMLR
jgi:hypothetical protein